MNAHLNRISNLVLLILGMCALCALIIESFHLTVPSEIWLWLIALCICLWFSASYSKGILFGMPLCAAILYYLWHNYTSDFSTEVRDVLDHVYGAYSGHYSSISAVYQYSNLTDSHMVCLLLGMFLIAAFTAACLTSGAFRISLVMLPSVLLFAVCIAVNGTPSAWSVILLILFWCLLFAGGDVYRQDDAAGKSSFIMALPCLGILLLLLLFYRPENYRYDQQDIDLSLHFDKLGNLLSNWMDDNENSVFQLPVDQFEHGNNLLYAPSGWATADGSLNLTIPYDYSAQNQEAFDVSSDQTGSFYLRGRSFGDYTGTSWASAVENDRINALSLTAQAIYGEVGTTTQHFQLLSVRPYPYLFLPYFTITDSKSDVAVSSNERTSYGGEYYLSSPGFSPLVTAYTGNTSQRDAEYREYAHRYYTRLPDSTRNALVAFCREHDFTSSSIDVIAAYIRQIGIYDLDVGALPTEDYAVYFLTEYSHGYCIHFATAACAIYRALDIPARVCEGYLVTSDPNQFVTVRGRDAHAWVEIYLDGSGWIPIEVTADFVDNTAAPGSSDKSPSLDLTQVSPSPEGITVQTPENSAIMDSDTVYTGENTESTPIYTTDSTSGSSLGFGDDNDPQMSNQSNADSEQHTISSVRVLLWIILIPAILGAALELRYLMIRTWIQRKMISTDRKQVVIFLYQQTQKLLRFAADSAVTPPIIQECAERARFSQHEITENELTVCLDAFMQLTQKTWSSLSKFERFRFKIIRCLI